MKFNVGNWVEVTRQRVGGPDVQLVGKVIEATRDYAVAECRTSEGTVRFTYSEDTALTTSFRRMTNNDWQNRKRRLR
jgi:hypothetical protein